MRLETSQPLDYYIPETVLVLTRDVLDAVASESTSVRDFIERINGMAAELGHSVTHSNYWMAGIRSVKVWLDGVSQADPTRLTVGVFASGHKPRFADPEYFAKGRGFVVVVESHATIA